MEDKTDVNTQPLPTLHPAAPILMAAASSAAVISSAIYRANMLVHSMSTVGYCCDNATCEEFFGMLKR
jgi:transposase InsO family protein